MTAEALLSYLSQGMYLVIFLVVARRAFREPHSANIGSAAFFGIAAVLVGISGFLRLAGVSEAPGWLSVLLGCLLLSWPYPLLRLAHEFTGGRPIVLRAAEAALALSIVALVTGLADVLPAITIAMVAYFVGAVLYASARFVRAARMTQGVLRKRLQAAAAGSVFVALLIASFLPAGADPDGPWQGVGSLSSIAAGLAYFIGFATPPLLRDAWLTPELRRFITQTSLASPDSGGGSDLRGLADALAANVGRVVGAHTLVQLVDAETGLLSSTSAHPPGTLAPLVSPETMSSSRSFRTQRPMLVGDRARSDPANAEFYRSTGARGVMTAPITLGERRFGMLTAVLDRPPLFAEDDLHLLTVLAGHVAVILRAREMFRATAELAAQRDSLRMKDEFLSAAAHDLKTPLTTLLAQAQLMQRANRRDPAAPPDPGAIERMLTETQRMRRLVEDLLDAARADQSGFIGATGPVDLLELVHEAADGTFHAHRARVLIEGQPTVAMVDRERMRQVVVNLVDNALKYSPGGDSVRVAVGVEGDRAHLVVTDSGIGIPEADQPHIFDRFRRGAAVDDRRFTGLGLGLYLCKRIIDEHGGTIAVFSKPGTGSTFTVTVPLHHSPPPGEPTNA